MKQNGLSIVEVLIVIAIVGILAVVLFGAKHKQEVFNEGGYDYLITQKLTQQGWRDVEIVSRDFRGCADTDASAWFVNAEHYSGSSFVNQRVCYEWDDAEIENDD